MSKPTAEQMVELPQSETLESLQLADREMRIGLTIAQAGKVATWCDAVIAQQLAEQAERIGELEKHSTAVARICEVNDQIAWGLVDLFDPELRGESPLLALKRLIPESLAQLTTLTDANRRLREALEKIATQNTFLSFTGVDEATGLSNYTELKTEPEAARIARTALSQTSEVKT